MKDGSIIFQNKHYCHFYTDNEYVAEHVKTYIEQGFNFEWEFNEDDKIFRMEYESAKDETDYFWFNQDTLQELKNFKSDWDNINEFKKRFF
jgi:ribulose bisphosphate carboxylase small subunit